MSDIPTFRNLSLERHGNVFVLTMQKPPENRLNSWYCQEMIRAYRTVEKLLGPDSEGAVITRGNDAKFWCTVGCSMKKFDDGANIYDNRVWN
jgi:enoyl-CoA hydratase/carnithine racemase